MSLDFTVRNIKMVKTECVQCADNFSAVKAHILTQHFYKKRFFFKPHKTWSEHSSNYVRTCTDGKFSQVMTLLVSFDRALVPSLWLWVDAATVEMKYHWVFDPSHERGPRKQESWIHTNSLKSQWQNVNTFHLPPNKILKRYNTKYNDRTQKIFAVPFGMS